MPKPKSLDLTSRLKNCTAAGFPRGVDYAARYQALSDYCDLHIHPYVVAAAAARAPGGLLTDHGTEHIVTVAARAGDLISAFEGKAGLSCLEIYLLLVAAQLHDIGNATGREGHELGAGEFLAQVGPLLGDDPLEKRFINQIARAHGGKYRDDKDTISHLDTNAYILAMPIRPKLLASLLRLADELADDRTRASRYVINQGAVPSSSEVYHEYALSLNTPLIRRDSITLEFEMNVANATRTFGKDGGSVYLLDEIFSRTRKMDCERRYCMRFLREVLQIDRVDVTINIFKRSENESPLFILNYRLEEAGYPSDPIRPTKCVCTENLSPHCDLNAVTGSDVADFLRSLT